jgi:hypothetical protein
MKKRDIIKFLRLFVYKKKKIDFRAGVEFRASSKIEIQNIQNPNFEPELNLEVARNSKFSKPKFRAGVEFRASSKIKIQNFQNPNVQLELNFVPAR